MSAIAQRVQLGPFFDQGVLCGGALLEHYAAGTSTVKDIWSDTNQLFPLANPFTADSNGVFNFFADGYYKIIIKKADGAILHTLDNFKIIDQTQQSLSSGSPVVTASSMTIGDVAWAHWIGSNDVSSLIGSQLFYWAIADGNFTLIHSSILLMPDSRNRKVNAGDVLFFINEGANIYRLGGHMQKEGGWTGRQCTTVAASATLAVPADGDFIDVSGGTTITAIGLASAGYRFRARFTGTGLNITYNATSMITPWGRDYRTVQNEILEFTSLGSGNWIMCSLNGPNDRVGKIISTGASAALAGYINADGTAVSRTTYSGLFAEIGTTFGAGDGSTTFNIPDLRGRVAIMVDGTANRITSSSTGGANADTLGGTGGAQTHTLVIAEMPAHTHSIGSVVNNAAGGAQPVVTGLTGAASGSTGGDGAHSNTQPWIALQMYIRF